MIFRYKFGEPIETGAVVDFGGVNDSTSGDLRFFTLAQGEGLRFKRELAQGVAVYGLGEAIRGINKRGWRYESFCSDDPIHSEDKKSLYGAHNFIVVDEEQPFGVFVDIPGRVDFDICAESFDTLEIAAEDSNLYFYEITGESIRDIVRQFRKMIGKSYTPPLWAFGYQQCRWSYPDEASVRAVAKGYKDADIPLDSIYLDIDYMERFKDFTVDGEKFPDLPALAAELKSEGIHLVPIIDAGVKIEDGYDIYEEGVEKGHFCKDENGENYVTAVWPGKTMFPDFLNSEARHWFGMKYKRLTDMGIDGFWNDMNEPAIFYSEKGLDRAWEYVQNQKGKALDVNNFFDLRDAFGKLSNSTEDYKAMYHDMDGKKVCHYKVHNLYGYNMTKSAAEALDEIRPNKRTLLFSRASYIGMHRFGGIWMGDNQSWWSHILLNLKMLPSLNMCGFLYTGADLGGFGGNCTRDLLMRWLALGIFSPLMRNHAALGTRAQECYNFEKPEEFREIIKLRYRLVPYLYSEFNKANDSCDMMFRPLAFDYHDDKIARSIEDQLMLGDEIMIAPVYEQNAIGRYVYLPEDMLLVLFDTAESYTLIKLNKGHHFIEISLNQVPIFIKKNRLLPLCRPSANTEQLSLDEIELFGWIDAKAEYELYTDDGISKQNKSERVIKLSAENGRVLSDSDSMQVSDGGVIFG
ncbi:MAG: TIM-barrel domain-containing protein [Acutalibacteraceae bacterium]